MCNYSFGLRGHDIAGNFEGMCEKAKENKVELLQFALAKTCNDVDFDKIGYDRGISQKINEELIKNELSVAVLGCYINPVEIDENSRKIQIERFKNFICYAKDFNAGVIGTETGIAGTVEETHTDKVYGEFLNNMSPLVEKAEEMGVKIGIEPVWIYTIYSVDMMERMIRDMQSDSLAVILDISNMITAENHHTQDYMIQDAFDRLGDRIRTIHLKDYKFTEEGKRFTPAGTGLLNTKLIFENIKAMKNKPQIILDELPLALYSETVERIKRII